MTARKSGYVLLLIIFLITSCRKEQVTTNLPRSKPEAEGVSSRGIINFLNAAASGKHEFHSIMFIRHGKVIAEGWWNPYNPDLKHTLYSTSKSFTATAVGFAVSEKKLSVNDKVVSFFPDALPDTVSKFLSDMTVKDLLSMSAGQAPDPTFNTVTKDTNWVKSFLSVPVVHQPGTKFLYNTLATYMLSAITQKVTGQKIIDYLKPRLFDPLSIQGMDWETDPNGINTGGWGLRLKTEDMAKFGQLFLQKGKWNGTQVIPAEWIEEATTKKIEQVPDAPQSKKDSSDWMQGYCYQMWRCRHNCFRADGAYGQFIIVMPDQDAVVAITAETGDMQSEINLVWDFLLPAIKDKKLGENPADASELKQRLSSLALPMGSSGNSPVVSRIAGRTFKLEPNDRRIEDVIFQFRDSICMVTMTINSKPYDFSFGAGHWSKGETTVPGPNLLLQAKGHLASITSELIAGNFSWKDVNTLELVLRYVESPHSEDVVCTFDKDNVQISLHNSNQPPDVMAELKGSIAK